MMSPEVINQRGKTAFWPRELALGLTPLLIGFNILISTVYLQFGLSGFADFRQLYTGGYMVRTGFARQLYDYDKQQAMEEELVPLRYHFLLPITHPAFEELFFAGLSFLPYRDAFLAFAAINTLLTFWCAKLLREHFKVLTSRWSLFTLAIALSSFPVWRTILQGQDSIILLTLLLIAHTLLGRGKPLQAGMLVGFGIFKFQIVVPVALLFLLWRRWKFVTGFVIVSVLALLASVMIVGTHGVHEYFVTIRGMSAELGTRNNALRYATISEEMLNVRGLLSALLPVRPRQLVQSSIVLVSLSLLLVASRRGWSLPLATTAASLVSYSFVAHDACILLLPIMCVLSGEDIRGAVLALITLVAPLSALSPRWGFLSAVPALALFYCQVRSSRSGRTDNPHAAYVGR